MTLRDCQSGNPIKTFRAMNTFGCGGTLIETEARDWPRSWSPGQGTWRHISGENYFATVRFFRFNGDGSFAETHTVTRHIQLSDDGNQFTATTSVEVFDAEDTLIRTGCATETARRLE